MLRNYLKTTVRLLLKNKTFSFINIIGLAIGTLCCLYIVLYVADQYSYDKHHRDGKDIYRLTTSLLLTGDKHNMATASPPIAPALKNDFPEVAQFTRVIPTLGVSQHLLRYKDKSFYEKETFLVDSTFFDVFSYHFISGSPAKAMEHPFSIVLGKPLADKLFGTEDPMGKIIELDNAWGKESLKVTGVIDESLGKSHIHAAFFLSLNGYGEGFRNNNVWTGNNFTYSYLKLKPGASAAALEAKFPAFLNKYAQADLKARGMEKRQFLQPIATVHTTSGYEVEAGKVVSSSFLSILLLIAILIQVIACINFMNLSTARASKRAKEVGVRKVIGAGRKSLIMQFLSESFSLSLIGVLIALPLLILALPWLNQLTEADITIDFLRHYKVWLALVAIILVTGLLAGSYPAFYLSAFDAIKVIKGNFKSQISAAGIRRTLVVFQFSLSIILIIGILVIFNQLNYIKNRDLGFNASQKLVFTFHTEETKGKMQSFMDDLQQLSDIKAVTKTTGIPGQATYFNWGVFLAGGNLTTSVNQENVSTDESFVKAMGIHLLSGRDFRLYDSGKVIINQTLAKRLGLTIEKAPGTKLYTEDANRGYEIAGVMKDFNYQSLHEAVSPFMLIYNPGSRNAGNIMVNATSKDYKTLLSKIETIWKKDFPAVPFDYTFLDNQVQKQYQTEITLSNIINSFTGIAILISCLGLFGLAAFSAEQRMKEIAVRKVLGASVPGLVQLLSNDFVKLVAISFVIATPIGWWAMDKWLQSFVYRIDLAWWIFALAGLLALVIALFTVSFQAIRAAIANPVKACAQNRHHYKQYNE
ncbi:ABC transporter permease [Paraflavitalea speifideaquila]|uniref:ABC transporter permease n=1 Tax=Paraflavitalea speifideaquila TaxID=3076558 RepID=UPI0028EE942D|nr:ABC transporter permease [Paraflavitalea speifideiaquila]